MGEARRRKLSGTGVRTKSSEREIQPEVETIKHEAIGKIGMIGYGYRPMMMTAIAIAMMESGKRNRVRGHVEEDYNDPLFDSLD